MYALTHSSTFHYANFNYIIILVIYWNTSLRKKSLDPKRYNFWKTEKEDYYKQYNHGGEESNILP